MCLHEFPQSPFVFHENVMYCEKCFKFNLSHSTSQTVFGGVKMMGNNRDTYTDRNKFAQYQVKSRHYKWLLLITEKFLKKPYQFHKYALAYLRKGRYAP